MKRRIFVGSISIVFLFVLAGAGVLMASILVRPTSSDSGSAEQGTQIARSAETPSTQSIVPGANVDLALPSHHFPTPATTPTQTTTAPPIQGKPTQAAETPQVQPTTPPVEPTTVPVQPTTPPTTSSGGMSDAEMVLAQQLFTQINQDRATSGLTAYTWSDQLVASAYKHNLQMISNGCGLSHQCPGEAEFSTRISNEGASWSSCGENIGYAGGYSNYWQDVLIIHQGMMSEQPPNDGHRRNLLSESFHRIGIGISISDNTVWLTEDFTD
jgi:uncharacterized protein YkwD